MLKQPTLVIILHEIYGINAHIREIRQRFTAAGVDAVCPNLFPSAQIYTYQQTDLAYNAFIQQVGFDSARQQILALAQLYRQQYEKLFIVGFSVGATTAWLASDSGLFDGIVGFYGSRIRDFTNLQPACPTLLFLPSHETAFSVDCLISKLSGKPQVQLKSKRQTVPAYICLLFREIICP